MAAPSRDVDPVSLRLFLAALDEGSLSRAAVRLNLVPSAVSKRMAELEDLFGVQLLERGIKGVRATPAGNALASHARLVLQNMDRMRREMAGFATGVRGRIRMAVSVAALSGALPEQIQSFRRAYPQIELALEEGTTQQVFRQVLDGQADLGMGSDFGHEGLQVFPYGSCQLAAVVPALHLLAERDTVSYEDLLPFELIELNRDNGISGVLERVAAAKGAAHRVCARVSSHDTICALVARGMGVGVVPMYLHAGHRYPHARFIPLSGDWSSTRVCVAVRELEVLSPAARVLLAHLRVTE